MINDGILWINIKWQTFHRKHTIFGCGCRGQGGRVQGKQVWGFGRIVDDEAFNERGCRSGGCRISYENWFLNVLKTLRANESYDTEAFISLAKILSGKFRHPHIWSNHFSLEIWSWKSAWDLVERLRVRGQRVGVSRSCGFRVRFSGVCSATSASGLRVQGRLLGKLGTYKARFWPWLSVENKLTNY